jgi:hypothetical protein
MNLELKDIEYLLETLNKISEKYEVEFYINIDYTMIKMSENLKEYCYQIEV